MKYLMIKLYIFINIFLSLCFSADCFNTWHSKFINDKDNDYIYKIYATFDNAVNSFPINLIFDQKGKVKIEYQNQVIILLEDKSMKLFKDTNQLYIDNPDSTVFKVISSIFHYIECNDKPLKISNKKYSYSINNSIFKSALIQYNDSCNSIDNIQILSEEKTFYINNILFKQIDNSNNDIDFNIDGDYFIYDLRM